MKNAKGFMNGFIAPKFEMPKISVPKFEMPIVNHFDLNTKKYVSPEEIIEEDTKEYKRPDFENMTCKKCSQNLKNCFSWYYLKNNISTRNSYAACCIECLEKVITEHNNDVFEIFEYSRCSAYFKCEELDNLRKKCERVENRTYIGLLDISIHNFCEPAQAGIIIATHNFTKVLHEFSEESKINYLKSYDLMNQSGEESKKQFRITTWMTILVIILTLINMYPVFFKKGEIDYSEALIDIKNVLEDVKKQNDSQNVAKQLEELNKNIENLIPNESK